MPHDKATFVRRVNQLLSTAQEIAALAEMFDEEVEHFVEYLGVEFDSKRATDAESQAEDRAVLIHDASEVMLAAAPVRGALLKILSEMTANSKQDVLRAMQDRIKR